MENKTAGIPAGNQFMKKKIFIGIGLLAAIVVVAQQVRKPQAPPPPTSSELVDFKQPSAPPEPPAPPVPEITVPAPPPPPPPKAPFAPDAPTAPEMIDIPDDYKAFLERNEGVKSLGWMYMNRVAIRLKTGEKEIYHLDNEEDVKRLESKYGKLPAAPPPPPPLPRNYQ